MYQTLNNWVSTKTADFELTDIESTDEKGKDILISLANTKATGPDILKS